MINKQNIIFKYCKRILTFDLQVLYSPNEPLHFLGFFTSWIWIRIQEAFFHADPCGSGSETLEPMKKDKYSSFFMKKS